jgi:signal transduction histidine kinase
MSPSVTPSGAGDTSGQGDLAVFNRWLCISRLRAAGGVVLFVSVLKVLHVGSIAALPVTILCAGLALFSAVVLVYGWAERAPRALFPVQHIVDLVGVTVGIGVATSGLTALLFRLIYFVVIVPPSLVSIRAGLFVAAGASAGHEILLALERGWSLATLTSIESLAPVFLFFLVGQQCFFYGQHLEEKNRALAQLAEHLQLSRQRLAGLVDVARTLNSTLEAPELLARVNKAALAELGADWAATFLVDGRRGTFRAAAWSDSRSRSAELLAAELPMSSWPVLTRLGAERVIRLGVGETSGAPRLLSGAPQLPALLLAGLYRDRDLIGFLALGYGPNHAAPGETLDQLNAIVEHAAIALRNAQLLEEARQASVLKSEFVSTISHELRTPLNVIIGYTDMLRDGAHGALSAEQQEVFDRIDTEARGLFELIEATLQVGRIETGRDTVSLTRMPMAELITALRAVANTLPRPPAVAFEWDARDTSGTMVVDFAKLSLILRNLLSNAFKFTTRGRVLARLEARDRRLVLTVADTGIGIAADSLPVIFEMFRQLDPAAGRQRGVGLGLYIVKQMVERLNGTIEVDSTPGAGSEFRVIVPGFESDEIRVAQGAA